MRERFAGAEPGARAEDIVMLYSRAHLQGSKYGDFSASSKVLRGKFRERMARAEAGRGRAAQPTALPPRPSSPAQAVPRRPPPGEAHERGGPVRSSEVQAEPELRQGAGGTRWYALHSVLDPAGAATEPVSPLSASTRTSARPPLLAVFSLAGGVGKTSLVATLGRALSALGEQVLLVDTAAWGLLPLYFGSHELKPGVVRTFFPSSSETDTPVQVLSVDAEHYPGDGGEQDPLLEELVRDGRGANRILVDIGTASRRVSSRLQPLRPTVLVPIIPDVSSVACLGSLETLLANPGNPPGRECRPGDALYLLNQFDVSSPLHLDVRALLQQRLGDRLLPFVLRRSSAVSEALAEGMTVIDYAPDSPAAEDYWNLARWLRSFAAAAGYAGLRWSER